MRNVLFCLASIATIGTAQAASAGSPIRIALCWHVSLDAQGHVTQLEPIPDKRVDRVPVIRQKIEEAIRGWDFMPGTVNGHSEPTETGLTVRAELPVRDGRITQIRITGADVGASFAKVTPPRYPGKAIRDQDAGEVVLRVAYDASGKPTEIVPVPDSPSTSKELTEASVQAVRSWTFQPEVVGGHALAGTAFVPICYSLRVTGTNRSMGTCDWKAPGGNHTPENGESVALNPAAKLLTDVAGRTL